MRVKFIKKREIALILGSIFLVFYIVIILILKSSAFQTYIASESAEWLSEELKAPVRIGKVDFTPFFGLELNDVFIGDREGDTIALIPQLTVFIRHFSYSDKNIGIGTIALYDPVIKIIKNEDGTNRYAFFQEYFSINRRPFSARS